MREFHIGKNDENQRLDRFLGKAIPLLPASLAQKYIRLKRIKVNGARAQRDQMLVAGDVLQCYINDGFFETPSEENVYLTITTPRLHIVYEDENIVLIDKPQGELVHADMPGEKPKNAGETCLVDRLCGYLYKKGEYDPKAETTFAPALCNRLDRNTSGLIAAGKTLQALQQLSEMFRDRSLKKYYLCLVRGKVSSDSHISGYLKKDPRTNRVTVSRTPSGSASPIETEYHIIWSFFSASPRIPP